MVWGQLPHMLALGIGIFVSVTKIQTHKRPAIFAACGFGLALLQSLFAAPFYRTVHQMFPDGQMGYTLSIVVFSSLHAVQTGSLLMAVFAGRNASNSDATTTTETNTSDIDVKFASQMLAGGATNDEIEVELADRGLEPSAVAAVMARVEAKAAHRTGWKNLIMGSVILVAGVAVTVLSYIAAAESPGGGNYVVTYGLILAGGVQICRGLVQVTR